MKVVLIFSDDIDKSTDNVIDWLKFYNINFIRITSQSLVILKYFDLKSQEFRLSVNNQIILSENILGYWYRRDEMILNFNVEIQKDELSKYIFQTSNTDNRIIRNFLVYILEKRHKKIGSFFNFDLNKLYQLSIAIEVGLDVPKTFLTNDKTEIPESGYITKGLSQIFGFHGDFLIKNYTSEIEKQKIKEFSIAFMQKNIKKKYEVRTFYLHGKMYSMAIFSQLNSNTIIDFRNYDTKYPNRNVPYLLPKKIEIKVLKFMKAVRLNTGSIDFIVNENGEHIFLEVNPIGQFGMVSYPCNYNLEKIIAEYFLK